MARRLGLAMLAGLCLISSCQPGQQGSASSDPVVVLQGGVANASRGDFHAAIAAYDRVLTLQPNNADALYLRGAARERLGDPTSALADYDAALALNDNLLVAYVARAAIHTARGDTEAARADLESAQLLAGDDQQQ